MHVAAFIGKLQHFKTLKASYLCTCKWAISPFLSDQVTNIVLSYFVCNDTKKLITYCTNTDPLISWYVIMLTVWHCYHQDDKLPMCLYICPISSTYKAYFVGIRWLEQLELHECCSFVSSIFVHMIHQHI